MSVVAAQGAGVSIEAIIWPACTCGRPYAVHLGSAECTGYQPSRPVEHLGTRAYRPPPQLGIAAALVCRLLWAVEFRMQGWREQLSRR